MKRRTIELKEYRPTQLHREEFCYDLGEKLWQTYSNQGIDVEFPSPRTGNQWQLTSQGFVGHIPLSPEVALSLQPKVPLGNLFAMLEYAYTLKSFRFLEDWSHCNSLDDFYERLADILASRILDRTRQGLYRAYIDRTERLNCLRGRLNIPHQIRRPWNIKPQCHFQEQTADIEETKSCCGLCAKSPTTASFETPSPAPFVGPIALSTAPSAWSPAIPAPARGAPTTA